MVALPGSSRRNGCDRTRFPLPRRQRVDPARDVRPAGGAAGGRARPRQPAPAQAPAAAVDFARDVQPLLERHCYECHGTKKARGRLRLHSPDYIAKGGQSGPVVVAGDTEQSLLMRRVLGLDGEDRMPLDADPLSDAELATLRGWIAAGAAMPAAPAQTTAAAADVVEHWAYVKPVRPPLPAVSRAGLGAHADRSLRAGPARSRAAGAVARGRSRTRCCGA